jgi:hypothetical protein
MFVSAEVMTNVIKTNMLQLQCIKIVDTAHRLTKQSQQLLVLSHAFPSLRSVYVHAATKLDASLQHVVISRGVQLRRCKRMPALLCQS